MQSDFVIDATGLNPVRGDYRIVDVRKLSNAYDVWSEYLCLSPTIMPTLSTCVFEAISEPPEEWFDEDGDPRSERSVETKLFPPAYFEGMPVARVESFVCGPLVVSPDGEVAVFALPEEGEIARALDALKWPSSHSLCHRIIEVVAHRDASLLSSELVSAYVATRYVVDDSENAFELHIGEKCTALPPLLDCLPKRAAAFVTGWNPEGLRTRDDINRQRNSLLDADLRSIGATVMNGRGIGSDETWPPEESFLALGLGYEQAVHIARHYGQNAFVWVEEDCVPKLILLR